MITCDSSVQLPFQRGAHGLVCDGVSIQSIVESVGTPAYVYSARAIRDAYRAIDSAFDGYPHAIHYALKANSTLAIARLLRSLGSRADANSSGEIAADTTRRGVHQTPVAAGEREGGRREIVRGHPLEHCRGAAAGVDRIRKGDQPIRGRERE